MNKMFSKVNKLRTDGTVAAIARSVSRLRTQQRLSLDQLAIRAGVSKGSLAALEKGAGNPSIGLLCQTATALGVSVSDLIESSSSRRIEAFELEGGKVLWRGPAEGTARLIFGTRGPLMFELWDWRLFPNERYQAKVHSPGTKEILYPIRGRLGAEVDGSRLEVKPGQGVFLETDTPHAYYCVGNQPVRFRMIVVEPPKSGASE